MILYKINYRENDIEYIIKFNKSYRVSKFYSNFKYSKYKWMRNFSWFKKYEPATKLYDSL